ncbi:choice-of-anchor R domain-containing protein [Roseateles sp.]|uniref:choice-of-anchor R domain-containing protein n=1 Tax=Roseateles sp. TaxID=1971397 RepID=UPI00286A68F8|nr:choice-of-anchor R domain-containing protein [Roseateles sp.]
MNPLKTRMRRSSTAVALTWFGLLAAGHLPNAHAAVLIDNLAQPTRATTTVEANLWAAQSFVTAGAALGLDSVTLLLGAGANSGSASAELRVDASGVPGAWLASLPLPVLVGGPPQAETLIPTLPTQLAPFTSYWLVLGASTAGDSFGWSYAMGNAFNGPGAFGNYAYSSDAGLSWQGPNSDDLYQLRIEVSPVPEPTSAFLALAGCAGLALRIRRRRQPMARPDQSMPQS